MWIWKLIWTISVLDISSKNCRNRKVGNRISISATFHESFFVYFFSKFKSIKNLGLVLKPSWERMLCALKNSGGIFMIEKTYRKKEQKKERRILKRIRKKRNAFLKAQPSSRKKSQNKNYKKWLSKNG